ncbi:hypothetical protein [Krasilnikovia sp. M28-CT-15]|uniref:hypothetical protein n=1 Tax=Krasilnikovia sp. M28-CT-15 TaxID=3373540 RepID=UPI0038777DFD
MSTDTNGAETPQSGAAAASSSTFVIPAGDETATIRAAAQWLVVAAGAVGAVLVAGLQLGAIGALVKRWPLLVIATIAFVAALAVVGWIIRTASAVLVIRRVTLNDLLRARTAQQARETGITLASEPDEEMLRIDLDISSNRWLLPPPHQSLSALYGAYRAAVDDALKGDAKGVAREAMLRPYLVEIASFARTELARARYQDLSAGITGWRGWILIVSIIAFAVAVGLPKPDEPPHISGPVATTVVLTGLPQKLHAAGLDESCAGVTLIGTAVDGTLTEPVVVTQRTPTCQAARFTVTKDIGLAIPKPK